MIKLDMEDKVIIYVKSRDNVKVIRAKTFYDKQEVVLNAESLKDAYDKCKKFGKNNISIIYNYKGD